MEPLTITTPSPCLRCSPGKDVLAAIAYLLTELTGDEDTTPAHQMTEITRCRVCYSDKELMVMMADALIAVVDGMGTPMDAATALKNSACYRCLPDKMLHSMIITEFIEAVFASQ